MVTRFGMHDDFGMVQLEKQDCQYLGGASTSTASAETQARVDAAVIEIVQEQYDKAYQILSDNSDKLDELADFLYEEESISGEQFMAILEG